MSGFFADDQIATTPGGRRYPEVQVFTSQLDGGGGNTDIGLFFGNASNRSVGPGTLKFEIFEPIELREGTQISESYTPGAFISEIEKSGGTSSDPVFGLGARWDSEVDAGDLIFALRIPAADIDNPGGAFRFSYGDTPEDVVEVQIPSFEAAVPGQLFDFLAGVELVPEVTEYFGSNLVDDVLIPFGSDELSLTLEPITENELQWSVTFNESGVALGAVVSGERAFFNDAPDLGPLTEDGFLDMVKVEAIVDLGEVGFDTVSVLQFAHSRELPRVQDFAEARFLDPSERNPETFFEDDVFGPQDIGSGFRDGLYAHAIGRQYVEFTTLVDTARAAFQNATAETTAEEIWGELVDYAYVRVLVRDADAPGREWYINSLNEGDILPEELMLAVAKGTTGPEADPRDQFFLDALAQAGLEYGLQKGMTKDYSSPFLDETDELLLEKFGTTEPDILEAWEGFEESAESVYEEAIDGDGVDDSLTIAIPLDTEVPVL